MRAAQYIWPPLPAKPPPDRGHAVAGTFVHRPFPVPPPEEHEMTRTWPGCVVPTGGGHFDLVQYWYVDPLAPPPPPGVVEPGVTTTFLQPGHVVLVPVVPWPVVRVECPSPPGVPGPVVVWVGPPLEVDVLVTVPVRWGECAATVVPVAVVPAPAGPATSTRVPASTTTTARQRASARRPHHCIRRNRRMEPSLAGRCRMPHLSAARATGYPDVPPGPQTLSLCTASWVYSFGDIGSGSLAG